MYREHELGISIRDRLREIDGMATAAVYDNGINLEAEITKRLNKVKGVCIVVAGAGCSNKSTTDAPNLQYKFVASLITKPVRDRLEAQRADSILNQMFEKLSGWWPDGIPNAMGALTIFCEGTTKTIGPPYNITTVPLQVPRIRK